GGRRQEAGGRRQEAGGRRQEAEGRRQKAGGSPYEKNFFTTMHESPSLRVSASPRPRVPASLYSLFPIPHSPFPIPHSPFPIPCIFVKKSIILNNNLDIDLTKRKVLQI
ncbi:MAG: hypothetical protein F6K41_24170, partial [Symploca sp. SIO3E6]|nr:hypothetical protein [Caldora sp. SIO3E6]